MRDRILIERDKIPYEFAIDLGSDQFVLKIKYNQYGDLFTISLYKNSKLIAADEPIMYNFPLFHDIYRKGDFPIFTIVPLDESNANDLITWENFNVSVFLTLENGK